MIGWVYESNKASLKRAKQDLQDFLEQDFISDMQETEQKEKEILEERIKNWEQYISMLQDRHNEAQRIQEEHLLQEMLGVNSQEEVYEILKNDMLNFVDFLDSNNLSTQEAYSTYNTIFTNFLNEYKNNVLYLQQLQQQQIQLMNAQQYLQANNALYQTPSLTYTPTTNNYTGPTGSYSNLPSSAPDWSSVALAASESGNRVLAEYAYNKRAEKLNSRTPEQNALALSKWTQENLWNKIQSNLGISTANSLTGYAEGIENGPITDTGLTMLHGSATDPEYVLNNDQAYTLLKNLATIEMNNQTSSLGDEESSSIGVVGLAKTELEGINTLIVQANALINEEALTNSQLAELMNILQNLYATQQQIQQFTENDFNQDAEFYTNLLDDLDKYCTDILNRIDKGLGSIEGYLSQIIGLLNQGINSIDGLVSGISGISSSIAGLSSQISGLGSSLGNYNQIYGSQVSGGLNTTYPSYGTGSNSSMSGWVMDSDNWAAEALDAAKRGQTEEAKFYLSMRKQKLESGYTGTGGQYGTGVDQTKLLNEVNSYLSAKGAATISGFANGIENGPVTSTGLTMLHGTDSNPEYVLNNEQAYQILKNLATEELELNNSTASMGDIAEAGIGIEKLVEDEIEGLNTIIIQLNALISSSSLTNSQLAEIMNLISTINQYTGMLYQAVTDEYVKNDSRFVQLVELLDSILEKIEIDTANDTLNTENIISAINGIGNSINAGLAELGNAFNTGMNSLNSGLANLGSSLASQISSLGSVMSTPSYNDIYGNTISGLTGATGTVSSGSYYPPVSDYSQAALDAANEGNREKAMYYWTKRAEKLQDAGYIASGGQGGPTYGQDQQKLLNEINSILASKGYANGIENGPVTSTGYTVLHGSNSSPEYVLNNDQAYQILRNLATQELEIDSTTSSMGDLEDATIGITKLVETEIEGLNTIIIQLSGMLNSQSLTNSELAEILNQISYIQTYTNMMYQAMTDEYVKNDSRFIQLVEELDLILEKLDMDLLNDTQNAQNIIGAINSIGNNIASGINQLGSAFTSGMNSLNNSISSLGSSLSSQISSMGSSLGSTGSYNDLYGSTVSGGLSSGTSSTGGYISGSNRNIKDPSAYPQGINGVSDWSAEAIQAAKNGDSAYAYYCVTMREAKISTTGQAGGSNYGNTSDKLLAEINSILSRGYANGIEEGPVTETGLAMLHGTVNEPEYVLNNDQAYTLLKNLSTTDMKIKTTSLGDETSSMIDDSDYATDTLENISTALIYLNAITNEESLTNSQLAEIMNIIGSLHDTEASIYQAISNSNTILNNNFTYLNSILEEIKNIDADDLENDKNILAALKNGVSSVNSNISSGSSSSNNWNYDFTGSTGNTGNEIDLTQTITVSGNSDFDKALQQAMKDYDYSTDSTLHGVSSFTDNSVNQGGNNRYLNGNTGGNYYVGENGVPDHYLGPQGEMIYHQTVGGTKAVDSLGNVYDVSEQGEYIKRGTGNGLTTERRLDLANTYQYVNGQHYWYDEYGRPIPMTTAQIKEMGITPIEYEPGERRDPTPTASTDSTGGAKNKTTAIDIHDERYFDKVYYDEKGKEITLDTAREAGLDSIDQYIFKYGAYTIGYRRKQETIDENSNLYNTAPETGSATAAGTGGWNNTPYISANQYEEALNKVISTATKDKNNNYSSNQSVTNNESTSFGGYVGGKENSKVDLNANYTQLAYEAAQNGDRESANKYLQLMTDKINQTNYTGKQNADTVKKVQDNVNNILGIAGQELITQDYSALVNGNTANNTQKLTEQGEESIQTAQLTLNAAKDTKDAIGLTTEAIKSMNASFEASITKLDTSLKGLVTWTDNTGGTHTGSTTQYNNASSSGKVDTSKGYTYTDSSGTYRESGITTSSSGIASSASYTKTSSSSSSSSTSSNSTGKINGMTSGQSKGLTEKSPGVYVPKSNGLRANGIEGGPVDKTGIYTLHGSKSHPEYVFNTEQAYQMLRNIATKDETIEELTNLNNQVSNYTGLAMLHGMPSIGNGISSFTDQSYKTLRDLVSLNLPEAQLKSNNEQDMIQYILNGDINLESDNVEDFFNQLTNTMQMRSNVTKNNRH